MFTSARQAAQERQRRVAQPIDLPLPLRGWLAEAKSAAVSSSVAARFENLWTDGLRVTTRPGYAWDEESARPLDRIPYEFGGSPHHLHVNATSLQGLGGAYARTVTGRYMAAYLSSRILLAGGGGAPMAYDGANVGDAAFTTSTGVAPSTFAGVIAHRDRAYFWPEGRLEFYHSASVGAITGPLTRFPLDRLGNITGTIVAMASASLDPGDRAQDLLTIVTSTGDVVLYAGDDPSDPDRFAIVARMKVARPVGRFCLVNRDADLLILTRAGVVSLRRALTSREDALTRALSEQIARVVEARIIAAETPDAWRLASDPGGQYLVLSMVEPTGIEHFVYGHQARAWSVWTGIPAVSWSTLGGRMLFTGIDGRLGEMAQPGEEGIGDDGDPIAAGYTSSWFRFTAGRRTWARFEADLIARGSLALDLAVLADRHDTAQDVTAASQRVTLMPFRSDGAAQALNAMLPVGADGGSFQLRLGFSATYAELTSMRAAMG